MANLNVREKLLEAKIAYVGAELSGKRTNFAQLQKRNGAIAESFVSAGAFLGLDIRPADSPPFDACALLVKLVGQRGAPVDEEVQTLLADADGVVVIVDAVPAAREKNRRSVQAVRNALGARTVPIVLQVNKTDLPDAAPAHEVVAGLDVDGWPRVLAAAKSGDGVDETLERVVHEVIQTMTHSELHEDNANPTVEMNRGEGHPLLTALRRVLEATVERQAMRLADELAGRIEQRLVARLDQMAERLDAIEHGHLHVLAAARRAASREDFEGLAALLRENLVAAEKYNASVDDRITTIETGTDVLRHHLVTCSDELLKSARHACTREDLATSTSDLRAELARTIDASTVANREYVTSASTVLRRCVEAVAVDVKKATARESLVEVAGRLDQLDARAQALVTSVEASSAPIATLTTRITEGDAGIARELRDSVGRRLASLDNAVQELASQTESSDAATQERTARLETLLTELIEELRKPKKGWFG